ncbi:MAG TPA: SRPBCC family protein [Candidatus Dormibacteraeota bacterium]|nr:SRPBCC family protein [Candidatus Dormibacteraeota bacterium]
MKAFTYTSELRLPRPLSEVFPFFAAPENLEVLTPSFLNFQIPTPKPVVMAVGTRIQYRIKIHRIPVHWESEITGWNPPYFFSDDQIRGPYRRWHH